MNVDGQLTAETFRADSGALVVRLAGELDFATFDLAVTALQAAVRRLDAGGLTVELSDLTFIDASGVRALVWAHNQVEGRDCR